MRKETKFRSWKEIQADIERQKLEADIAFDTGYNPCAPRILKQEKRSDSLRRKNKIKINNPDSWRAAYTILMQEALDGCCAWPLEIEIEEINQKTRTTIVKLRYEVVACLKKLLVPGYGLKFLLETQKHWQEIAEYLKRRHREKAQEYGRLDFFVVEKYKEEIKRWLSRPDCL